MHKAMATSFVHVALSLSQRLAQAEYGQIYTEIVIDVATPTFRH
jgi:hypothetical protein